MKTNSISVSMSKKGIDPNVFLMMYDHWIKGKNRGHDSSMFSLFINEWRYS